MRKVIATLMVFSSIVFFGCSTDNNGNTTVVPLAPGNLTATVISTTQVNLQWADNATNETGYKIQRKTGSGSFTDVGSTGTDISNYSDLNLTPNTTYAYRVYAYNSAGNSLQYSNTVTVTTALLPSLTTTSISDSTATSAKSGGNITSDAGSAITARGVCWSTSPAPTVALSTKTVDGTGTGSFSSNITGLTANTTYYVRAYATNSNGTAYGGEVSFTTSSVDITTGLVGYWPFNGNANDESGNGNNGTVNGATLTSDRIGNTGKAYYFSGNSDYISTTYQGILGTSDRTVSFWAKQNINTVTYNQVALGWGGNICGPSGIGTGFYPSFNVGSVGVTISTTESATTYNSPSSVSDNNWHHYVFVKDGTTSLTNQIKVYQDGVLLSQQLYNYLSANVVNTTSNANFAIGMVTSSCVANRYFTGYLDDIRIYNRALTQAEISYLATH